MGEGRATIYFFSALWKPLSPHESSLPKLNVSFWKSWNEPVGHFQNFIYLLVFASAKISCPAWPSATSLNFFEGKLSLLGEKRTISESWSMPLPSKPGPTLGSRAHAPLRLGIMGSLWPAAGGLLLVWQHVAFLLNKKRNHQSKNRW